MIKVLPADIKIAGLGIGSGCRGVRPDVDDPVCINTEGLLMYFTDSETGALCDNIRMILKEHGGCWLTADIESAMQYIITTQCIAGERFMELLKSSRQNARDKSDVELGNNSLNVNPIGGVEENMKKAMMFLASHGLKAERMIVGDYMPELSSFSKVTPKQAEAIKQGMKKCAYWKITPMNNDIDLQTVDFKTDHFDMQAKVNNNTFELLITGRVDTLTAPNILTLYERVQEECTVDSVVIDCSQLEYISSAGLRVLLIMQKGSGATVKLAIDPAVMEILEQTGFDSILEVEEQ